MTQHWIGREFTRTGLPKSALAAYLGVDNAAVSRMLTLERQLSPEEGDLARGFFSIVSGQTREEEIEAIRRLRSTKVRESAGLALSEWLLERIRRPQEELVALLRKVVSRTGTLTTDQIVALCRLLEVDIEGLIAGKIATGPLWSKSGGKMDILAELQSEARHWVKDRGVAYQFDRMADPAVPRAPAAKAGFVKLQPAEPARDDLAGCIPYLIPDDSAAPRFEQGQTIFLDPKSEPRNGEYVAVLLKDSDSVEPRAVLGRLLYVSRDRIGLSSLRSIRMEMAKSDVDVVRRIAYCKM